MSTSVDLEFDDGTPVRFLFASSAAPDDDRPEGMGRVVPAAADDRRAVARFAMGTLRNALKPLGPLLQEVHNAVGAVPDPPSELSVTFGVQIGQDLKLGIVSGNAQAHLTVTASWSPAPAAADGGSGDTTLTTG